MLPDHQESCWGLSHNLRPEGQVKAILPVWMCLLSLSQASNFLQWPPSPNHPGSQSLETPFRALPWDLQAGSIHFPTPSLLHPRQTQTVEVILIVTFTSVAVWGQKHRKRPRQKGKTETNTPHPAVSAKPDIPFSCLAGYGSSTYLFPPIYALFSFPFQKDKFQMSMGDSEAKLMGYRRPNSYRVWSLQWLLQGKPVRVNS
jgi:hypothetical protein